MSEGLAFSGLMGRLHALEPHAATLNRVAIRVERPVASIGPKPSVPVLDVSAGFDWERSTLLITPVQPLTPLTPDDVAEMHRLRAEGSSYAMQKAFQRWYSQRLRFEKTIRAMAAALKAHGAMQEEIDTLTAMAGGE